MHSNLYVKTNYSLLTSLISISKLIEFCHVKNIKSIAICDDNLSSCKYFYNECIKNNIKPVIGLDVKYNDSSILLYAKNYDGYKNLIKLSTIISERNIEEKDLKKYSSNLVSVFLSVNNYKKISEIYENSYIGFSNTKEEQEYKKITNDVVFINKILYFNKKDDKYIKYLTMIKEGKTILDNIDFIDNYNYFLDKEVFNLSDSVGINNTNKIIDLCNLELNHIDGLLPIYDDNIHSDNYLANLSIKGLNKRLNNDISNKYKQRLVYELDVIKNMGFSNYFLVVYDFIRYAKKNNILVGPGRGSAAGSLVAYSLGITEIDPIKYDLLFERFLNPERVTMPDIDTDIPDIYRQDIINYVKNKYGEKKVSGIITYGTMAPKLALRDVARCLNIPIKTVDNLCKRIPTVTKLKLKDFYNQDDYFRNTVESTDKLKLLFEVACVIENFPRHTSMHAAGIVMSNTDLDEVIPLVKSDDLYLSGYPMEHLEELGLLKMDFLGIKNLTTIMNIISDIEKYEKIKIDFSSIPLDDFETFKIFQEGNTSGVFQFESEGMKNFLRRLKPNTIDDIFAAIALYRPGPSVNIDSYINRKYGKEKIDYLDSSLEKILKPTYGIIIYQEQIMQIANVMAGFSLGEADILRRAMSKKKIELLKSEEEKFINGSISNGYTKEKAKEVYDLIMNFANYGFNKSHSVAYSVVAYKMAYLKAKYPKYFYSNLLSSVINNESKTIEYINEARKLNIKILLPNINFSTNKYEIVDDGLIYPISNIKNVGIATCKDIIENRRTSFTDIYECFSKIYSRNVNKSVLESLIQSSCFDCFGYNKNTLLYNLDSLINYASLTKELDIEFVIKPEIEIKDKLPKEQLLEFEKNNFGFYLSDHPSVMYKAKYNNIMNLNDIEKNFNKNVNIICLIEKIKTINTKNNDKMAFLLTSDETGSCDITLFPKDYEKYKNIETGKIVLMKGNVQRRFDKYQIVVNNIEEL